MQIISASRRTDIPAFYSEWLLYRIHQGFVRWRNPFNSKIHETSLKPEDVMVWVFFSKNYQPFLSKLPELDKLEYRMVFHYTITGLPSVLEPHVPMAENSIPCFQKLSKRYNSNAVIWRYDPILISNITEPAYHIQRFKKLAASLEGYTHRCIISFPTYYGKVIRNMQKLQKEQQISYRDPSLAEKLELLDQLAQIGLDHGIQLFSCCSDVLVQGKVQKAHCIDKSFLMNLFPDRVQKLKMNPTRKECGCCDSRDIGAYDTCPHGCIYCYANMNPQIAVQNYKNSNPETDLLTEDSGLGGTSYLPKNHLPEDNQGMLPF